MGFCGCAGDDGKSYIKKNLALHEDLQLMIKTGKIHPTSQVKFPLEKFADAYQIVQSRRSLGKVTLDP